MGRKGRATDRADLGGTESFPGTICHLNWYINILGQQRRCMDASTQETVPESLSPSGALDGKLVQGIAWTGGVKWSTQIVAWAATLFVARVLSPDDYGLVGMATVYL